MKIGRNDPCPCGSRKKYKKCCLRKNEFDNQIQTAVSTELTSDFEHIKSASNEINRILQSYKFEDAVMATFCLNLWRKNRSAIQQCLTLNMALDIGGNFGQMPIQSYSELESFYRKISSLLPLTGFEDYVVDDYGEVFINFDGKSYPVILGTGHQQVYAVIRYLQTLVDTTNHDKEFKTILEYIHTILLFTVDTNVPNIDYEIKFELPTEDFWNSIKQLFDQGSFKQQFKDVAKIMDQQPLPIEMKHFTKHDDLIFPLFNASILIDFYKLLLLSQPADKVKQHVARTIHSLVENTFNFSDDSPSRVLINPVIINRDSLQKLISNELIFSVCGKNTLLIALDSSCAEETITSISQARSKQKISVVEPYHRPNMPGSYGIEIDDDFEIIYMVIDPFTDITSGGTWLEAASKDFKCTALDVIYLLGFSDDIEEIIEFIRYETAEKMRVISFGGKSSIFFQWKNANRHISSGAVEYSNMFADHNASESYTISYFTDYLAEFPRNDNGLFSDPLHWKIEHAQLGYDRAFHKGCHGFGGEIKRIDNSVNVFLAKNVAHFCEQDFSQDVHTAVKTVDEVNERLFVRYAKLLSGFEILQNKTLQMLFIPWGYAQQHYKSAFLNDFTRKLVYSDEYVSQDGMIIRYSFDPISFLDSIKVAPDRRGENEYFKELLLPLKKYSQEQYDILSRQLDVDSTLKKTVGVFHIEQDYYFSDMALDTEISPVSFAKARKEIAKVCLASGVQPGEYRGKAATNTIRQMQTSIVAVFEKLISTFQQDDLHQRILNYLSVQQNGTIVNIKRYTAFAGLDEEVQQEFEQETRTIREGYRRNTGTALYLLESNLAVSHIENTVKCSKADFEYLLAFADWLVVLQDAADTCHHIEFDLSISVDSEYKVDTIISEQASAQVEEMLLRKYSNKDYRIKNDQEDIDFFKQAIEAFKQDTTIDLGLLVTLADYLQLGIIQDGIANEIYPNVFKVDISVLINKFNGILENPVSDTQEIVKLVDFLTIDPASLKTLKGEPKDHLPIWERKKRNNCFTAKPILRIGNDCIFSPVSMHYVQTSWRSGITEWYPPYEIGLENLCGVLKQWKKRYEDEMVQDIAQLFRDINFDLVEPEIELVYRFPRDDYPEDLGDYDVLAISMDRKEIWIIESKVLQKVGSIYADQMQQKSFFFQGKYDEQFQKRIDYMTKNALKVLDSLGVKKDQFTVVPYMVTNKLFASRYKIINFPIISYSELQALLSSL